MPRTALTVVQSAITGVALGATAADVANGNEFNNADGRTYLHVRNSGVAARTLTLEIQNPTRPADANFPAATIADGSIAFASGVSRIIGPINPCFVTAAGKVEVGGDHAELLLSPFRV